MIMMATTNEINARDVQIVRAGTDKDGLRDVWEKVHWLIKYQCDRYCRRTSSSRLGGIGVHTSRFGETVNVSPLLSCQGAVDDALRGNGLEHENSVQLENANLLSTMLDERLWRTHLPHESLRSGVMLIRRNSSEGRDWDADQLRSWFHDRKMAVTTYDNGLVRLSMPKRPWHDDELELLRGTLGPTNHFTRLGMRFSQTLEAAVLVQRLLRNALH